MATGDYTTLADVKDEMNLGAQTTLDPSITAAIPAASRALDNLCNRRFYIDTADADYYYTPVWADRLHFGTEEFDSITSVNVDFNADGTFEQVWVENTEYVAYPLNRTTPYRPIQWIKTHPLSARFFPIGYPRTVKITGRAGWATTPAPIVDACKLLTVQVVKRKREAQFGVLSFADVAAHIARTDPQFALLVDGYRRV